MGKISTKQAAELLRVTPVRVRQLIAEGQLQSEKVGRDHLLELDAVLKFDTESRRKGGRPRTRPKPLRVR
jgi:excisionase family DNA binding protein